MKCSKHLYRCDKRVQPKNTVRFHCLRCSDVIYVKRIVLHLLVKGEAKKLKMRHIHRNKGASC